MNKSALILIFLGGGTGSLLRYLVSGWAHDFGATLGDGMFPVGTLTVNVLGCLVIGFVAPLVTAGHLPDACRWAIVIGLLGGFTTFSSFGYETVSLVGDGQFLFAIINVVVSNSAGLAATWLSSRVALAIYGA